MQITDIETSLVRARETPDERNATVNYWHYCIVQVHTNEGIMGIGEATAPGMERATEMAVQDLGRHIVGRDPRNVEGLWDRMYHGYAWNWGPVSMTALSGIEMALWDVIGKYHDVRICDLLGGPEREQVKVYANGDWSYEAEPERLARQVADRYDRGYDMVKFDPFYADGVRSWPTRKQRHLAADRLEATRNEVGTELEIGVEGHGVLSPAAAVECAQLVEPYGPMFIEEPVPPENPDAMRRVRDRIDIPIATGERLLTVFDYRNFLQHPVAADIVQPDVNNCGGILQLKKIASMAYSEYLPVAPHNSRGPIATAAAAHAAATIPNFLALEYFPDSPPWRQDFLQKDEVVEDGFYHLPDGPGLGIELDESTLDEYPFEKPDRTEVVYSNSYRGIWN